MLCSWLCAKSKAIVRQDGRSGETRGREKNGYIEFRLARLASLARLAVTFALCLKPCALCRNICGQTRQARNSNLKENLRKKND